MSTREQQNVAPELPNLANDTISSRTDLPRGFAAGASIAKQFPLGPVSMNLTAAATLVLTIVPLKQIFFNLDNLAETGQLTSPGRPLQWAGQNLFEFHPIQPLPEAAGIALAALG
jgi:hypothetical protein